MAEKIDQDLKDGLLAVLKEGISEDAMKAINKSIEDISYRIECDVQYAITDNLARNLMGYVVDMASRAVEQILEGNEDQLRRYLSCEKRGEGGGYISWTGRSTEDIAWGHKRAVHEWHPVIHGRIFEQGALALRKKIVDAHRDVLANERILDLEDQVKSLTAQVNKAKSENDHLTDRRRDEYAAMHGSR